MVMIFVAVLYVVYVWCVCVGEGGNCSFESSWIECVLRSYMS